MSCASDNNQEPGAVLLNADHHSDPLSTRNVPNKFDHNISKESNFDDLMSSVVQPHYSVIFSRFSAQCVKYILNKFKLIVTWAYEDPTLFRGGG
ncbi:unnamed protein product [Schistosoma curassoni]|uniref:Uncharacterized protein n=1 Tax=Schistosoma curassoni TaxID=6186 RepID=A0A183KW31_9TREM|nr:unnamed protein product [Schistosoma curassoni]